MCDVCILTGSARFAVFPIACQGDGRTIDPHDDRMTPTVRNCVIFARSFWQCLDVERIHVLPLCDVLTNAGCQNSEARACEILRRYYCYCRKQQEGHHKNSCKDACPHQIFPYCHCTALPMKMSITKLPLGVFSTVVTRGRIPISRAESPVHVTQPLLILLHGCCVRPVDGCSRNGFGFIDLTLKYCADNPTAPSQPSRRKLRCLNPYRPE